MRDSLQETIQRHLRENLISRQARNSSYSLRSFARMLGMNSGAVSAILAGKRRISKTLAKKISTKLALDPRAQAEVDAAIRDVAALEVPDDVLQLTADQFSFMADGNHFAIIELLKTVRPPKSIEEIASRLRLTVRTAEMTVERLVRLKLLERSKSGALRAVTGVIRTTDEVRDTSLQKAHSTYLDRARQALETIPVTERDFTALTTVIHPDDIPLLKKRIRGFIQELDTWLARRDATEVANICIQFFPLTDFNSTRSNSKGTEK